MRSSLIVIYLSVSPSLSLSVCLWVCSSYWPALKRSSLQNFSVYGHFAHYKPTKKKKMRLWKPETENSLRLRFLAFQLQLQLLLRCSAQLVWGSFWSFYAGVEWSGRFQFSQHFMHFMPKRHTGKWNSKSPSGFEICKWWKLWHCRIPYNSYPIFSRKEDFLNYN